MMKYLKQYLLNFSTTTFILFTLFSSNILAQTFTSSNLPIILITTDNQVEIPDEPKVFGTMKIIYHPDGSRNYLTDKNNSQFLNYNDRISIEVRGSTSQAIEKKPYGLTTLEADNVSNNNVSLLGMPEEIDWILNPLAFDPTLIRDYISYNTSRKMGNYATRTQYCEVVVNNVYVGLYILQEKIKSDENRVNITKISETDISGTNLTGGYITKADKVSADEPIAFTMSSYSWETTYIHTLPKPDKAKVEQTNYIFGEFTKLKMTARNNNISLFDGFPTIIDVPSFIDFMLSNELASNPDGYQFSTYFHKDKEGKLRACPIWDFNLTYGNDLFTWGYDRSKTDVWQFSDGENDGSKFWTDLFNNPTFKCYFSKRWFEVTASGQPMNYNELSNLIDNTTTYIAEARVRESQRWGAIGNYTDSIAGLKKFLADRIDWISTQLSSYESCSNTEIPPLVITKINYNPKAIPGFSTSNEQEFIGIKNIGNSLVNLSGIYLRELGVTYQFPYNSTIDAGATIYLASDTTIFKRKYGSSAFGKFTRNLSNTTEKLVLSDAFGNIIDYVEYTSSGGWPVKANGQGSFLQLIDDSNDNNDPTNWVASSSRIFPDNGIEGNIDFLIYPNPASSVVTIDSPKILTKVEFYDVSGNLVKTVAAHSELVHIDLSDLTNGFYIVKLTSSLTIKSVRLLKQ